MRAAALFTCLLWAGAASAAGNGAGAGGAGHQRAINSGLVDGEKGPPGAPNNRKPTPNEEGRGAPRTQAAPR